MQPHPQVITVSIVSQVIHVVLLIAFSSWNATRISSSWPTSRIPSSNGNDAASPSRDASPRSPSSWDASPWCPASSSGYAPFSRTTPSIRGTTSTTFTSSTRESPTTPSIRSPAPSFHGCSCSFTSNELIVHFFVYCCIFVF